MGITMFNHGLEKENVSQPLLLSMACLTYNGIFTLKDSYSALGGHKNHGSSWDSLDPMVPLNPLVTLQ